MPRAVLQRLTLWLLLLLLLLVQQWGCQRHLPQPV
jgi:hypothetical protein